MESPADLAKEMIKLVLRSSHLSRCLLQGCVYGIPGKDKSPRKDCIYCGLERSGPRTWFSDVDIEKVIKQHYGKRNTRKEKAK